MSAVVGNQGNEVTGTYLACKSQPRAFFTFTPQSLRVFVVDTDLGFSAMTRGTKVKLGTHQVNCLQSIRLGSRNESTAWIQQLCPVLCSCDSHICAVYDRASVIRHQNL